MNDSTAPPATLHLPLLAIGPVRIEFPAALAALAGYSDWCGRIIARRHGAGYAVAEVMLDRFVLNVSRGRKVRRFIRISDEDHPVGAQLMGSTAEEIAPAAVTLAEAGFDVIDLNLGCPVKKVVGKCRGGWLLGQPAAALEIIARVREALPPRVPLTLKMRRGLKDDAASRDSFYAIFDGAFARGVAAVTVHPRTVAQRYEGRSAWPFLAELKRHAPGRIILGSGDLFTAEDCMAMLAQTGVDGLSIARGAIGNPWIFRDVRALAAGRPLPPPPTVAEQLAVLREHYALAEAAYGAKRAVGVMAAVGIKYARRHPRPVEVRDAFARVRKADDWQRVVQEWY